MIDIDQPISDEEARKSFEAMLSRHESGWSEIDRTILRALFDLWTRDRTGTLGLDDLGKSDTQITITRSTVQRLRAKLEGYNQLQYPIAFEIPKGVYCLTVWRKASNVTEDRVLLLFDRDDPRDNFEQIVCEPSSDVLLVTIASNKLIGESITQWFNLGKIKTKHFRVLTWRPLDADESAGESLATYLGQFKRTTFTNCMDAWRNWKQLERDHDVIEVCGYHIFPAILSTGNDHHLKIEMLPFNAMAGRRAAGNRPAIFLDAIQHRRAFAYFRQSFNDLWLRAIAEEPEEDVHPNWRAARKALLRERGLVPPE